MIDITGPKVSIPTLIFTCLSLANLKFEGALLFIFIYYLISRFIGIVITRADLLTSAALFVVLNNPASTNYTTLLICTLIFAFFIAFLRTQFPLLY